jgi:hypothetical protein
MIVTVPACGELQGRAWVPPGKDGYLLATRYSWYPELAVQSGEEVMIRISSGGVLHGSSLVIHLIGIDHAPVSIRARSAPWITVSCAKMRRC